MEGGEEGEEVEGGVEGEEGEEVEGVEGGVEGEEGEGVEGGVEGEEGEEVEGGEEGEEGEEVEGVVLLNAAKSFALVFSSRLLSFCEIWRLSSLFEAPLKRCPIESDVDEAIFPNFDHIFHIASSPVHITDSPTWGTFLNNLKSFCLALLTRSLIPYPAIIPHTIHRLNGAVSVAQSAAAVAPTIADADRPTAVHFARPRVHHKTLLAFLLLILLIPLCRYDTTIYSLV